MSIQRPPGFSCHTDSLEPGLSLLSTLLWLFPPAWEPHDSGEGEMSSLYLTLTSKQTLLHQLAWVKKICGAMDGPLQTRASTHWELIYFSDSGVIIWSLK